MSEKDKHYCIIDHANKLVDRQRAIPGRSTRMSQTNLRDKSAMVNRAQSNPSIEPGADDERPEARPRSRSG
ncbi:MAG TPA: hypothetical protein PKK10_07275 [Woeseiaceae bacterium]|nr:hypothetical protein [Woeseiaceae bacterium]